MCHVIEWSKSGETQRVWSETRPLGGVMNLNIDMKEERLMFSKVKEFSKSDRPIKSYEPLNREISPLT